jgi:hypothetical protein
MSRLPSVLLLLCLATISYAKAKEAQPTGDCHKYISVAIATEHGITQLEPSFVVSWWRKNAKKFPDICNVSPGTPHDEPGNYLLLVSASQENLNGVTSTIRTYTSTSNYAVRDSSGYTSSGTITTSTPVREIAEFTDNNNTIFMNVYDSRGSLVGQESHLYSVRAGGDDYETFGHNVGFLIGAINARGRMLKSLLTAVDRNDDIGTTRSHLDPCSRLPEGANGCNNGRTVNQQNWDGPATGPQFTNTLAAGQATPAPAPPQTLELARTVSAPKQTTPMPPETPKPATVATVGQSACTAKAPPRKPTPKCTGEPWYVSPSGEPICVWNH